MRIILGLVLVFALIPLAYAVTPINIINPLDFSTKEVTVLQGTTVRISSNISTPYTVYLDNQTKMIEAPSFIELTFKELGTFEYYLMEKPEIRGVIHVVEDTNQVSERALNDAQNIQEKQKILTNDGVPQKLDQPLPEWIREVFRFWSDGRISDVELLNTITYLVDNGIIKLKNS